MKSMFARLLACFLVVATLVPCVAVAELNTDFEVPEFADIFTPASGYVLEGADVPTVQWTHESQAISFQIPAEWTVSAAEDGSMFPIFYAEDGIGNLNITVSETYGEDMILAFDEIKQVFTEQYTQAGANIHFFERSSYGGRSAIVCELDYLGYQQTQVMIQPDDCSALLIFTFTASAHKYIDLVMDSVWLA